MNYKKYNDVVDSFVWKKLSTVFWDWLRCQISHYAENQLIFNYTLNLAIEFCRLFDSSERRDIDDDTSWIKAVCYSAAEATSSVFEAFWSIMFAIFLMNNFVCFKEKVCI